MHLASIYAFRADIEKIPFHVSNVFDDIDDIYWAHSQMYQSVLNEHAPLKTKWVRNEQVPYICTWTLGWAKRYTREIYGEINISEIKVINKPGKIMLNWEIKWLSWRKFLSKRILIANVMHTPGVKNFPRPSGLFCLIRLSSGSSNVILREGDVLITDPVHVAEVFNNTTHPLPRMNPGPHCKKQRYAKTCISVKLITLVLIANTLLRATEHIINTTTD